MEFFFVIERCEMINNPCMNVFSEILRVIDSLQLTDRIPQIATPANWVPGDKVMIAPTVVDADADKLFDNQVDYIGMPSGKNYVRTTNNY